MSLKLRWFLFALSTFPFILPAQSVVTVTDASIAVGATVNWTKNNIYLMDGLVYVDSASVLNIEAGTVIKGKLTPTTGDNTSALIVARYGKINATGTAANPIIFTAESDDVSNPNDLGVDDRGLWGGVIILGNAKINTTSGIGQIEGIATTEPRGSYGGTNDDDNSGVFRYVSIRHGGSEIGAGNEINGLSMGAVGRNTLIEYIEVLSNLDDGYEWFGGTVNTKYLVSAFCADDAFDFDEGWTGKNQFWFALQGTDFAGRIAEQDGGTTPEDGLPFAIPLIYNATYLGPGTSAAPQGDGAEALIFRDNAGGKYYNSIITEYNGGGGGVALRVEDLTSGADSRQRLETGDLVLSNNIWWNFGAGNDVNTIVPQDFVRTHFQTNNNQIVNPQITSISRTTNGLLDPRPNSSGPAGTGATVPSDAYFTATSYYGAFAPGAPLWTNGWTALSQYGFTAPLNEIIVTDADVPKGATVNWTSNNTYVMDGLVYVDSASVLNIEAGTVVKGKLTPTTGDNTSALIVARYGKINATGTAANPIIFTAESDDVSNPNDLGVDDRGLWGGVIILGNAKINTTSGIGQIEGIATTEPRGSYGGTNDDDNSGVFRYVSLRHGGSEIGAGNEINGLTMGAVGRGTLIEYIEVLSNLDDGYEWFGGTVNTKYLVSAFCADDGFDFDEGWTGKNQFWFALQGTDFAGRIAEQDGGTTPEDGLPFAIPLIYNATYIGPGTSSAPQGDGAQAMIFRDNAGGKYYNSIITEYNGAGGGAAITVEDLTSGADSRQRLETGDLVLSNNIWWNFGAGNDAATIVPQDFVRTHFLANNNQIVDPQLRSISRTSNHALDPRPGSTGPAATGAVAPSDAFFTNVAYYGAFSPTGPAWIDGWTAISQYNILTGVEDGIGDVPASFSLEQNFPNPFNPSTVISYSLPKGSTVTLRIYDMLGRKISTLVEGFRNAGTHKVSFDANGLPSGMYLYRLSTENFSEVRKMLFMK